MFLIQVSRLNFYIIQVSRRRNPILQSVSIFWNWVLLLFRPSLQRFEKSLQKGIVLLCSYDAFVSLTLSWRLGVLGTHHCGSLAGRLLAGQRAESPGSLAASGETSWRSRSWPGKELGAWKSSFPVTQKMGSQEMWLLPGLCHKQMIFARCFGFDKPGHLDKRNILLKVYEQL